MVYVGLGGRACRRGAVVAPKGAGRARLLSEYFPQRGQRYPLIQHVMACGVVGGKFRSRERRREGSAMRHELKSTVMAALLVSSLPVLGAGIQTETFDSSATAAANGWTLYNGANDWGWQNSSYAGGSAGEARAATYTAGTQRWYADLDLGGALSFSEDWQASGRMDFNQDSASDGGMFFGFFNRDTTLTGGTQTVAGFLLVNGELTLRFERRPDPMYLETNDFGLWVNDDRAFNLFWDADGGGTGVGRLTASLTRLSDNSTIEQHLDVSQSLLSGGIVNSFGFYAMDFASGRYTPFGWAVDNLSYGPASVPEPGTGWLLLTGVACLGLSRRRRAN